MPARALRPCAQPGCSTLVEQGRCADHARRRQLDERRGSARERGYDRRWERERAHYLAEHPLCVHCEAQGRVAAATVVDHVIPHRGDRFLFWLVSNWQPLCADCHAAKTARESGLAPCQHALRADVETVGEACGHCGVVLVAAAGGRGASISGVQTPGTAGAASRARGQNWAFSDCETQPVFEGGGR